jgi:hypothetical protein
MVADGRGRSLGGIYYLGLLAQTCERAGRIEEALVLVDTALEMADTMGERWFEACGSNSRCQ